MEQSQINEYDAFLEELGTVSLDMRVKSLLYHSLRHPSSTIKGHRSLSDQPVGYDDIYMDSLTRLRSDLDSLLDDLKKSMELYQEYFPQKSSELEGLTLQEGTHICKKSTIFHNSFSLPYAVAKNYIWALEPVKNEHHLRVQYEHFRFIWHDSLFDKWGRFNRSNRNEYDTPELRSGLNQIIEDNKDTYIKQNISSLQSIRQPDEHVYEDFVHKNLYKPVVGRSPLKHHLDENWPWYFVAAAFYSGMLGIAYAMGT